MIRVRKSITVNRPVEDVFRFLTEAGNIFKYSRTAQEVRQLTTGPIRVGARFELISRFMGRQVPVELEVTALDPNRELASVSLSGPFKLRNSTRFESVAHNSTVVSFESEITPTGFWRFFNPILPAIIRSNSDKEYAALENILSTRMGRDDRTFAISASETVVAAS